MQGPKGSKPARGDVLKIENTGTKRNGPIVAYLYRKKLESPNLRVKFFEKFDNVSREISHIDLIIFALFDFRRA